MNNRFVYRTEEAVDWTIPGAKRGTRAHRLGFIIARDGAIESESQKEQKEGTRE